MEKIFTSKNGLLILAVFFGFLLVILSIAIDASYNVLWKQSDVSANSWATTIQNSSFTSFATIIGMILDPIVLIVLLALIALMLWMEDSRRDSFFFTLLMIVSAASIQILKITIQRMRPVNMLVAETGFSFPSGHATMSLVLFSLLSYLVWKHLKNYKIKLTISASMNLMIIVIGFTRLYLNVHWLSDIVGGYALGAFLLSGSVILEKFVREKIF